VSLPSRHILILELDSASSWPGKTFTGTFKEPISAELFCKPDNPKRIVFQVAFGTKTESLERDIVKVEKLGREHPANPVVRWAKLARSEPTILQ
jgi:hypothetical protein